MKLRVAICDDDNLICNIIEDTIEKYAISNNYDIVVDVFYDGLSLIKYMEKGLGEYDLIYLDIEMNMLNGVETGIYIRSRLKDRKIQIVYISGYSQYDRQLFDVQPLYFIQKPLDIGKIIYSIDLALEILKLNPKFYFYKKRKEFFQIQIIDIIYFENEGRKVKIHTIDNDDVFVGNIKDIAKELRTHGFIQLSQSLIVNYNYVKKYAYEEVILINNKVLSIPKSKRNDIRKQFLKESEKHL